LLEEALAISQSRDTNELQIYVSEFTQQIVVDALCVKTWH
jgi:uncharacterized protein YjfI (DUF2170 family)